MSHKIMTLLSILIGCSMWQCQSDTKEGKVQLPAISNKAQEQLINEWEVMKAERDGSITDNLDGIYFRLTADTIVSNFNLKTEEQRHAYQIEGKEIIVKSLPPRKYVIDTLSENEIIFNTKVEGIKFRLSLRPIKKDSLER